MPPATSPIDMNKLAQQIAALQRQASPVATDQLLLVRGGVPYRADYPSPSSPVPIPEPDQVVGIKNVKDYGAVGNGTTFDTAAIQAAVNRTTGPYSTANRGVIFFPPGIYQLDAPIAFEATAGIQAISFVGAPGAKIRGNFADALLKRSSDALIGPIGGVYQIANLILENNHPAGKCVMFNCIVGEAGMLPAA